MFRNEHFGFRKITIEQPLRLRFQITSEGIDALREITAFQNLAKSRKKDKKTKEKEEQSGRQLQQAITDLLESFDSGQVWMDRAQFVEDIASTAKDAAVKLTAPIKKAIVAAIGLRDESAAICLDSDGNPEPDTELRDHEYVPLLDDVNRYFSEEIKPHAPDAWIDESKCDEKDGKVGIVGYELMFNREFYRFEPSRSLSEITSEVSVVESRILSTLAGIMGWEFDRGAIKNSTEAGHSHVTLPRYPEYQATDIPWASDVPKHWAIQRLKGSVDFCRNGIWGDEPDGINDILCVRVADFDRLRFSVSSEIPTQRCVLTKQRTGRVLHAGDLLLEKSGGGEQQPVGAVVWYGDDRDAVCSNFIARMPVATGYHSRFLMYLHAYLYAKRVNTRSIKQTTGIQNLDSHAYLNEKVGMPPEDEQQKIVSFLDVELERIVSLVDGLPTNAVPKGDFLAMAVLLQEYCHAVIGAAVTGAIDVRSL